jgi:hypothetical protein
VWGALGYVTPPEELAGLGVLILAEPIAYCGRRETVEESRVA